MTEERIKECPECGGSVRRLFGTGAGVLFKGSGFYETDYRSDSYKSAAKAEKAEASSSSSSSTSDSGSSKSSDSKKKADSKKKTDS
jgi:predicted nucleic acid-binding Zn ribbon protein